MTFEERLKLALGEQVWSVLTLAQRLDDAQAKIAELEKKEPAPPIDLPGQAE